MTRKCETKSSLNNLAQEAKVRIRKETKTIADGKNKHDFCYKTEEDKKANTTDDKEAAKVAVEEAKNKSIDAEPKH
jgi:hypothetical protein